MSGDDRELTCDEAQRALSEAMRRTMGTVPAPSPAELIAFVRETLTCRNGFSHYCPNCDNSIDEERIIERLSALLTVLEGRRQDDPVPLPDAAPSPWRPIAEAKRDVDTVRLFGFEDRQDVCLGSYGDWDVSHLAPEVLRGVRKPWKFHGWVSEDGTPFQPQPTCFMDIPPLPGASSASPAAKEPT